MAVLYNTIGENYDVTRRADPAIVDTLSRMLSIESHGCYLDVACGTGNYTVELSERGGMWSGVELSKLMLQGAQQKSNAIEWKQGDVEALPWEDGVFDGGICTLATHHFADLSTAFAEVGRVMKTEGSLVVFTTTPQQTGAYWLKHYFPKMIERSAEKLTDLADMTLALQDGGFSVIEIEPFFVTPQLQDFFLYSGKHRPEMYLSPNVRQGISSFARLIESEELEGGLSQLERDIESGEVHDVIRGYQNDIGDYLFIRALKQG